MKPSPTEISPLMRKLSAYIASAVRRPLPREVVERVKLHIVDTYASMISGSRLPPGRKAIAYARSLGGRPEAGVVGTRLVTSAANAALANGMFGHADETDGTHSPSRTHPGTSVVPAALAIGERQRLPGRAVLRAMVLGYDICARVLLALRPQAFLYAGHHPSSFGQVFGAAAAAGALLKLNACHVRYLMSYAAQHAAGLSTVLRDTEHVEKAYVMGGMTAHNGTAAALMVSQGWTGVEDVFSGERDFFSTFAAQSDRHELTRGLGREYEIMRCSIKRWTAGGPIQGPLQALYELMQKHGLKGRDVAKLVARLGEKELPVVDNRSMPNICIQHLLAVMLLDGTVTFKSAHDYARMKNPKVLALRKLVQAVGDPAMTDVQRRWGCAIEITLKDGRKLTHHAMAAKGSFANPLTRREEEEKALDLIVPVLGKRRSAALLAVLWEFERIVDVRSLRKLVSA